MYCRTTVFVATVSMVEESLYCQLTWHALNVSEVRVGIVRASVCSRPKPGQLDIRSSCKHWLVALAPLPPCVCVRLVYVIAVKITVTALKYQLEKFSRS